MTHFEYKYAVNKVMLSLPTGGIEDGIGIIETAKKELLEETGYEAETYEIIKTLHEHPSKLTHSIHIIRAKNARRVRNPEHEPTESISEVHLLTPGMKDYGGEFENTYTISALALTLPEYLKIN